MSILSDATTFGLSAMQGAAGEAVTYNDGSNSVSLTGVRAQTRWTKTDKNGVKIQDRGQTWHFKASDLVDGSGSQIEPDRNHTITTAAGDVFKVLPGGADDQNWEWVDPIGQTFRRVYSKER